MVRRLQVRDVSQYLGLNTGKQASKDPSSGGVEQGGIVTHLIRGFTKGKQAGK